MAYEQHEWVNGETITAEKLNNIEEGIAEAAQSGGGGDIPIAIMYFPNSTIGWQTVGMDFATALATVADGKPIAVLEYEQTYTSGAYVSFSNLVPLYMVEYDPDYPNRINLRINSSSGWYWTENGFEYWD